MKPVIAEYRKNYPDIQLYARGDSGFAAPELYDLFEDNDVKYAIRLKINKTLLKLAQDKAESLIHNEWQRTYRFKKTLCIIWCQTYILL